MDTSHTPTQALPAELSIYTAAELHAQWSGWLAALAGQGETARVHAAAVEQVDAAGLQLLLALAHALQRQGQQLQLQEPSAALAQACEALGLQTWLQQHSAAREVQEACA